MKKQYFIYTIYILLSIFFAFFFFNFYKYFQICEKPEFNWADWLVDPKGLVVEAIISVLIGLGFYKIVKKIIPYGSRRKFMVIISTILTILFGFIVHSILNFTNCFWIFLKTPYLWIGYQ